MTDTIPPEPPAEIAPSSESEMSAWLGELESADPERHQALVKAVLSQRPHLKRALANVQAATSRAARTMVTAPAASTPASLPQAADSEALYSIAPYMRPVHTRPQ